MAALNDRLHVREENEPDGSLAEASAGGWCWHQQLRLTRHARGSLICAGIGNCSVEIGWRWRAGGEKVLFCIQHWPPEYFVFLQSSLRAVCVL